MPKSKNRRPNKKKRQMGNDLPNNYEEQIKTLTAAAISIVYGENSNIDKRQIPDAYKKAQQSVKHPDDAIPKALANVSLWVLSKIESLSRQKAKAQIRPVIVLSVIGNIVAEVGEVAVNAGIFDVSEEDYQVAVAAAVNMYASRAKRTGLLNPQQIQLAAEALRERFPAEARRFEKMIQDRAMRQQQGTASPAPQQDTPPAAPAQAPPQQGLLGEGRGMNG